MKCYENDKANPKPSKTASKPFQNLRLMFVTSISIHVILIAKLFHLIIASKHE